MPNTSPFPIRRQYRVLRVPGRRDPPRLALPKFGEQDLRTTVRDERPRWSRAGVDGEGTVSVPEDAGGA
jgi:hypothetical protein